MHPSNNWPQQHLQLQDPLSRAPPLQDPVMAFLDQMIADILSRPRPLQDRVTATCLRRTMREAARKCPRCTSIDTKFSYFANGSPLQPRYSCKTCHRSWTEGGKLRNVPVGGRRRRNWSSNSPTVSLNQPPLRFTSPLLIEYAVGADQMMALNYGQVNYNSISASMGEGEGGKGGEGSALNYAQVSYNSTSASMGGGGGGSSWSGGGSGGATGSILFAPGLEEPQVPQTRQFPLLGGLEASPGSLCRFEGSDGVAGGAGYGAGGASIRPMVSTSGVRDQVASETMEDEQQLNLAMYFTGTSEQYRNNIGGGSGTGTISSAWPWSDL